MRIIFCGYRKWSHQIFRDVLDNIEQFFKYNEDIENINIPIVVTSKGKQEVNFSDLDVPVVELRNETEDLYDVIYEYKPDAMFLVGWSWRVSEEVLNATKCFCIHPSKLPRYAGGSPIQNQIIAGEKNSAVTLFKMTSGLDDGPIMQQKEISLEGTLNDIFKRVIEVGTEQIITTIRLLPSWSEGYLTEQVGKGTVCKRRKPKNSEITNKEMMKSSAEYLYNKIRCVAPNDYANYPVAYFVCADGKKIYFGETWINE